MSTSEQKVLEGQRALVTLPNAALVLFPDSNHGSQFRFTQRFNRYMTDFLDR